MLEQASVERTADLLERARAGDRDAFDRLFARALPRLRWLADLRLGPELRARLAPDDVVQETYAAALPLLPSFEPRGEGALVRWLFALAENRIRALAAHHGALHRRATAGGPADAALALAADPTTGPCTRAARLELRGRVGRALARLAGDEREALVLRVLQGRPLAEVAAQLERSESAVRRLVARALERVGRSLGEDEA